MNSQPNHKPLESLPNPTIQPLETIVTICVSSNVIKDLVPFLLGQHIPFSMSAFVMEPKVAQTNQTRMLLSTASNILVPVNPTLPKVEVIYQKYIIEGIEKNAPRVEEIAAEFDLKTGTFKSTFKKHYGTSFYQLYMEKRMEYAAKLLLQGMKASKVAECMGYSQPIKLNKMFQKYFGMTPKKYQVESKMKGTGIVDKIN